jgi:hypothetical protein
LVVPTHKDLPDQYLDPDFHPDRRPRRRLGSSARAGLTVGVLAALFALASMLWSGHATPVPSTRLLPTTGGKTVAVPGYASESHKAGRGAEAGPPVTAPRVLASHLPRTVLAVGTSLPEAGRKPDLLARTSPGEVIISSRSPAELQISVSDTYGHAPHSWTTMHSGDNRTAYLLTEHYYGYCFTQNRSQGFAATRGCGRLVIHQYLDGARLLGQAPATTVFHFIQLSGGQTH